MEDRGAWAPPAPRHGTGEVVSNAELRRVFRRLKSMPKSAISFCIPCYIREGSGEEPTRDVRPLSNKAVEQHCKIVHAALVKSAGAVFCSTCGNPFRSRRDREEHIKGVHKEPMYDETCRFFGLFIWAKLDQVDLFQPWENCDDTNFCYQFRMHCGKCGLRAEEVFRVQLSELVEHPSSQARVHLVHTCEQCHQNCIVQMLPGYGCPHDADMSFDDTMNLVMVFKCSNCVPSDFSFGYWWKAESVSGTTYKIDATSRHFAEYDELGSIPIGVYEMDSKFDQVGLFVYEDGTRTYLAIT